MKNKTTSLQIGVTSLLEGGNHVLLWESDNDIQIQHFIDDIDDIFYESFFKSYKQYHLTIYKSDKGYHIISLNEFPYRIILHIALDLMLKGYLCNKQLGFAIRQGSFTLRITEKTEYERYIPEQKYYKNDLFKNFIDKKPKEIVYHQWGSLPISKPHYEIFKLYLNNPIFNLETDKLKKHGTIPIDLKYFDKGYELKGYKWEQ